MDSNFSLGKEFAELLLSDVPKPESHCISWKKMNINMQTRHHQIMALEKP